MTNNGKVVVVKDEDGNVSVTNLPSRPPFPPFIKDEEKE
jgi:hypothetical protein